MTMPRIHYTKPSITELEAQHALDAAANAQVDAAVNTLPGSRNYSDIISACHMLLLPQATLAPCIYVWLV